MRVLLSCLFLGCSLAVQAQFSLNPVPTNPAEPNRCVAASNRGLIQTDPGFLIRTSGLISGFDAYSCGLDWIQVEASQTWNYGLQLHASQVAGISSAQGGLFAVKKWKPFSLAMAMGYEMAFPGADYPRYSLLHTNFQLSVPLQHWQFAAKLILQVPLQHEQASLKALDIGLHRQVNERTYLGLYTRQELQAPSVYFFSIQRSWQQKTFLELRINQQAHLGVGIQWMRKKTQIRLFLQYKPFHLSRWQNEILVA